MVQWLRALQQVGLILSGVPRQFDPFPFDAKIVTYVALMEERGYVVSVTVGGYDDFYQTMGVESLKYVYGTNPASDQRVRNRWYWFSAGINSLGIGCNGAFHLDW